jgi:hypothetical protein
MAMVLCGGAILAEEKGAKATKLVTVLGAVFCEYDDDTNELTEVVIENDEAYYVLAIDKAAKDLAAKMQNKRVSAVLEKKVIGKGEDAEIVMVLKSYKSVAKKKAK